MTEEFKDLVKNLVERGESDNYIRERLLQLGLKNEEEAKQVIHGARMDYEMVKPHLMTESDAILMILGVMALLILFVWFLLVSFR